MGSCPAHEGLFFALIRTLRRAESEYNHHRAEVTEVILSAVLRDPLFQFLEIELCPLPDLEVTIPACARLHHILEEKNTKPPEMTIAMSRFSYIIGCE